MASAAITWHAPFMVEILVRPWPHWPQQFQCPCLVSRARLFTDSRPPGWKGLGGHESVKSLVRETRRHWNCRGQCGRGQCGHGLTNISTINGACQAPKGLVTLAHTFLVIFPHAVLPRVLLIGSCVFFLQFRNLFTHILNICAELVGSVISS